MTLRKPGVASWRTWPSFNNTLPENRYRKYIKLTKEDVLSKIKQERDENNQESNEEGEEQ